MKADAKLRRAVQDELHWEPSLNEGRIDVAVENGVVTLTGHVRSNAERQAAEQAARRVRDVRSIANRIAVDLPAESKRADEDIARAATAALASTTQVPAEGVQVAVEHGWVHLQGVVPWRYQKEAAERAVHALHGVVGVRSQIEVKPVASPTDLGAKITGALRRTNPDEFRRLRVGVDGGKVTLHGKVSSWARREEAERVAWSAPGVSEVDNRIAVPARRPSWIRAAVLAAVAAVLCGLVAFPLWFFLVTMGWLPAPTPYQPIVSPWGPGTYPRHEQMEAAPGPSPPRQQR